MMKNVTMEEYIKEKKEIYNSILEFLEQTGDNFDFPFIKNIVQKRQYALNSNEMKEILLIIKSIADHHHRCPDFIRRINEIIKIIREEIEQTFSNEELFEIFQNNKMMIKILIENGMVTITKDIFRKIEHLKEKNDIQYCHFFYPELKKLIGTEKIKYIENDLLKYDSNVFDNYEENRKKGENESYICSLIRQDSVEEFISYVERTNMNLESQINPSIFETNKFLMDKYPSLIEYAAFYGSIQIFQYLCFKKVELKPILWSYSIHSHNAELIHLLESYNIEPNKKKYIKCFNKSIKCHHNDIASYIENNYDLNINEAKNKEKNISTILNHHNYLYFPNNFENSYEFYYLGSNDYQALFKYFLKNKKNEIDSYIKIPKTLNFFYQIFFF